MEAVFTLELKMMHVPTLVNDCTCVISWVVISMACSSSLLSSSVGRFMCLSWSKANSFIFSRIRLISYWIWEGMTTQLKTIFSLLLQQPVWPRKLPLPGCFYLIDPLYPFGRKLFGDSNGSFRIQADPRHQSHSIICQLKKKERLYIRIQNDDDGVWFYFYHEGKPWQYLIKLLMWLCESRVVPSNKEQGKGEKGKHNRKWGPENLQQLQPNCFCVHFRQQIPLN